MRGVCLMAALMLMAATAAVAQDPVKVDAKHYKVETENSKVRVLRVHYGAHEKSVMHYHPDSVAIFLNDGHVKFTLADGKTQDSNFKAGQVVWEAAMKHLPENVGDQAFELILVELKGKTAAPTQK